MHTDVSNETIGAKALALYDAGECETVTTGELREGDVIVSYRIAMRLRDRGTRATDLAPAGSVEADYFGPTVWFRTDILDASRNNGFVPASWLRDWTCQGNNLASWCRVKLPASGSVA